MSQKRIVLGHEWKEEQTTSKKTGQLAVNLNHELTRRCGSVHLGVDVLRVCEVFVCIRDV